MKYSAFTILSLVVAVLAVAWYWPDQAIRQTPGTYNVTELAQLTQRVTVPTSEQGRLERANRQLQGLTSGAPVADATVATVQLIEPRPAPARVMPPAIAAPEPEPTVVENEAMIETLSIPDYLVSMIFVGPSARYAVVDGLFRAEGDFMPDGSRVERISEQGVQLKIDNGISHWYRVAN